MKKLVYLSIAACLMLACNSNQNKNEESEGSLKAVDFAMLLESAETNIEKEVLFTGWVDHVCKHGGKRCILNSEDGESTIRVEAGEQIGSFDTEANGNKLEVTGVFKVNKVTVEQIDEWQAKIEAAVKEGNEEHSCSHGNHEEAHKHDGHDHQHGDEGHGEKKEHGNSQLAKVEEMRNWMKENEKDYYPVYYVEGSSYKIVNE